MKKIVCFVLLAALSLVTTGAVFADQTDVAPADVKTAIKAAITDPPVSVKFLVDVWNDSSVATYLVKYPDLTVQLSGGQIILRHEDTGQEGIGKMEAAIGILLTDIGFEVGVNFERTQLVCEGSSDQADVCRRIKAMFKATPQSVFWAMVKTAVENRSKQS